MRGNGWLGFWACVLIVTAPIWWPLSKAVDLARAVKRRVKRERDRRAS